MVMLAAEHGDDEGDDAGQFFLLGRVQGQAESAGHGGPDGDEAGPEQAVFDDGFCFLVHGSSVLRARAQGLGHALGAGSDLAGIGAVQAFAGCVVPLMGLDGRDHAPEPGEALRAKIENHVGDGALAGVGHGLETVPTEHGVCRADGRGNVPIKIEPGGLQADRVALGNAVSVRGLMPHADGQVPSATAIGPQAQVLVPDQVQFHLCVVHHSSRFMAVTPAA